MKKSIFLLAIIGISFLAVHAQEIKPEAKPAPVAKPVEMAPAPAEQVNPNAPEFKFDTETHDFGNISEGTQATWEFEFTNTGKEPLIIQNVRASCGCTTPSWTKEPVPPGGKGKVKAVYNSSGRPGNFNKAVTITSNAKTPTKVIYIKGNVEKQEQVGAPEKKPSIMQESPK